MPLPIDVADSAIWAGVALRYWELDVYFLPVCEWTDDVPVDVTMELPPEDQAADRGNRSTSSAGDVVTASECDTSTITGHTAAGR